MYSNHICQLVWNGSDRVLTNIAVWSQNSNDGYNHPM